MINFHLIPASLVNFSTFLCMIDCCHDLSIVVFVSSKCGALSRMIVSGVFFRDINLCSAMLSESVQLSYRRRFPTALHGQLHM